MTNEELLERVNEKFEQQSSKLDELMTQLERLRHEHVGLRQEQASNPSKYKHLKEDSDNTDDLKNLLENPKDEQGYKYKHLKEDSDNMDELKNLLKRLKDEQGYKYKHLKEDSDNIDVKENADNDKVVIPVEAMPREKHIFETEDDYISYLCDFCRENYKNGEIPAGVLPANYEKQVMDLLEQNEKNQSSENIISQENSNESLNENSVNSLDDNFESQFAGEECLDISDLDEKNNSESKPAEDLVDISKLNEEELRDIYSDSSKKSTSTIIKDISPEEEEELERELNTDYKKDKGTKTKKVSKIRKAFKKIKDYFTKNSKIKAIAGILVGTIGLSGTAAYNSLNNNDNQKNDDVKATVDEYDGNVPSVVASDSFGVSADDMFNKIVKEVSNTDDEITVSDNSNYETSDEEVRIGDPVEFTGSSLYETSDNAKNNVDPLTPYYSNDDDREVSLVQYMGPNGEVATAYTKEDQKVFEEKGWTPIAVNFKNNSQSTDTYELKYEGWANLEDVKRK